MKRPIGIHSFFIEMILVLLFMGISAAAAIQLFAGAHMTAQKSAQLNSAMLVAQSCAETALSAETPAELETLFSGDKIQTGQNSVVAIREFDRDWQPTADAPLYLARTEAEFSTNAPGTAVEVRVTVWESDQDTPNQKIFVLSASHYFLASSPDR